MRDWVLHSWDRYQDFVSFSLKYETETETQHFGISRLFRDWKLGFFQDRDLPRLGKNFRDQDCFEILFDLCDDITYRCPSTVPSTKPSFYDILYSMVLTFGCKVPSNNKLFDGTVLSRKQLFDGTVPSTKQLFDGTVPSTEQLFDGTVLSNSFSHFFLLNFNFSTDEWRDRQTDQRTN